MATFSEVKKWAQNQTSTINKWKKLVNYNIAESTLRELENLSHSITLNINSGHSEQEALLLNINDIEECRTAITNKLSLGMVSLPNVPLAQRISATYVSQNGALNSVATIKAAYKELHENIKETEASLNKAFLDITYYYFESLDPDTKASPTAFDEIWADNQQELEEAIQRLRQKTNRTSGENAQLKKFTAINTQLGNNATKREHLQETNDFLDSIKYDYSIDIEQVNDKKVGYQQLEERRKLYTQHRTALEAKAQELGLVYDEKSEKYDGDKARAKLSKKLQKALADGNEEEANRIAAQMSALEKASDDFNKYFDDLDDSYASDTHDIRAKYGIKEHKRNPLQKNEENDDIKDFMSSLVGDTLGSKFSSKFDSNGQLTSSLNNLFNKTGDFSGKLAETLFGEGGGKIGKAALQVLKFPAELESLITNPLGAILKAVNELQELNAKALTKFESITDTAFNNAARLDIGVLGNEHNIYNIVAKLTDSISSNPYISQATVFEKLNTLLSKGVVYNVEQRSILGAIADRMESTFDVSDEELINLTKLQQSDVSASQLGTRSLLTEFLNTYFEDNSYMNVTYNSVLSTLQDTLSQMTTEEATEFNYTVQKWLGSMYSMGVSSNLITSIAQGINALGTGDYSYFSNENMNILFGTASNGAYTDWLVNGVDSDSINTLLYNIVSELADIQADSNNVTKKIKAGLWGDASISDLKGIANLVSNPSDIAAIYGSSYSYNDTLDHVNNYLMEYAVENTTPNTAINNIYDNFLTTLGQGISMGDDGTWNWSYIATRVLDKLGTTTDSSLGSMVRIITDFGTTINSVKSIGDALEGLKDLLTTTTTYDDEGNIIDTGQYAKALEILGEDASAEGILTNNAIKKALARVKEEYTYTSNPYQASWYTSSGAERYSQLAKSTGGYEDETLANILGINVNSDSYWDLYDMSSVRGDLMTNLNSEDITTGISKSYSIGSPYSISKTSITNTSDSALTQTLSDSATTIEKNYANYSNGATEERDINSLYAELFEKQQHPIRVSLAKVEDEAQNELVIHTYNVSDEETHNKLDAHWAHIVYL